MDPLEALEEERRRRREAGKPVVVTVEPTPTGETIRDRLVSDAEPYVRALRSEVFGSPSPPWQSMEDAECKRWEGRLLLLSMRGGQLTGAQAAYIHGVEALERATGFDQLDIKGWVLTGARPALHPAVLHVRFPDETLPDGTRIRRRFAQIDVNAPVEKNDLLRLWRRMARMWKPEDDAAAIAALDNPVRRQKEVTKADRALEELRERFPDMGWTDLAEQWAKEGLGTVTADAIRKRARRLEKKKRELGLDPATTTED